MNYKLIMLDNPILVSDEDVNPHNEVWDFENNQITVLRQSYGLTNYMKIIAGLPDLPKVDLSLIAEEIGWVDVEKLAKDYSGMRSAQSSSVDTSLHNARVAAFREGFKAAQSLNEKKWTNDDMIYMFKRGMEHMQSKLLNENTLWDGKSKERAIKSLELISKPKEYLVEVQMEVNQCDGCISGHHIIDGIHKAPYPSGSMVCKKHLYERPKITNNTIKVIKIIK